MSKFWIMLVVVLGWAGAAWAEEGALAGPMRTYSWSVPPRDCKNISGFIWVNLFGANRTDPVKAAYTAQRLEGGGGRVALYFCGFAEALHTHPNDRCRRADGTYTEFQGPWCEAAVPTVRAAVEDFLTRFKAAGGRADLVVLDDESNMTNWFLALEPRGGEHLQAILNDTRGKKLRALLGLTEEEEGSILRLGLKGEKYKFGYTLGVEDLSEIARTRTIPYLAWNDVLGRMYNEGWDAAIFKPAERMFPGVKTSNYNSFVLSKERIVPETNGHLQYSQSHAGNHASVALYGELGNLAHFPVAGGGEYGATPFACLRHSVIYLKAVQRSNAEPLEVWISHKQYSGSLFRDNDYYQELIYHAALAGAGDFLYWNPTANPNDAKKETFTSPEQDRLVDRCLEEINGLFGSGRREALAEEKADWGSKVVVSAMRMAGEKRVLYRVTAEPGVKRVRAVGGAEVVDLKGGVGAWVWGAEGMRFEAEK